MSGLSDLEQRELWEWVVDAEEQSIGSGVAAATIATDSACTVGIIGQNEIAYVQGDTWSAPTVRVQTACGVSESSTMGYLLAVDSEGRKRRFEGYLLPECPYSLWPVADRVKRWWSVCRD